MKGHHTKDKGDLGVLKAQADLAQKGWLVLKPQSEHIPFDLVVYKNGIFKKVQVKFRSVDRNGTVAVKFKSYWSNRQGVHASPSDLSEIDIVCIYCPELDRCCYISVGEIAKGLNLVLRVKTPKNNQKKGVKLFNDYSQVP